MLIESVLGNLHDASAPPRWADAAIDELPMSWLSASRRAHRGRTRAGMPISILLAVGLQLHDGDVLVESGPELVVVRVSPIPLLIARPVDLAIAMQLAVELGNLHIPTQVEGNEIRVEDDGPAILIMRKYAVPFERQTRVFSPLRASIMTQLALANDFVIK